MKKSNSEDNKLKAKLQMRQRRAENKEKSAEYQKQWRLNNPEKAKEHSKRSREKRKAKIKKYQKAWILKNKDKHTAKSKEWYQKNKDKVRNRLLMKSFGISLDEYNRLFKEQEGKCAICGREETARTKILAVDHCHKTGKLRKLLCRACNVGIGNLQDSIELLEKAIMYLKAHS
jgi:carbamoylphosphate synthase small subunit